MKLCTVSCIGFVAIAFKNALLQVSSFTLNPNPTFSSTVATKIRHPSSALKMAKLLPDDSAHSTVGIVGKGYISYLTAKLASKAGYKTWMLYPPSELDTIKKLMQTANEELPENLEFLSIEDGELVQDKIKNTNALIFAADDPDNGVVDSSIIQFMINEATMSTKSLKRVCILSRNLNGSGLGFFSKAAKATANSEVWSGDEKLIKMYKKFENQINEAVKKECSEETDVSVVRAGTLKGGACGDAAQDDYFPQYLSPYFYEVTKKDIITWQLLFDCNVRGVKLFQGDSMQGPGGKAILTANSSEACEGDSSRCAVAEALVRSMKLEKGVEFAVGTTEGRIPPTENEWEKMLVNISS